MTPAITLLFGVHAHQPVGNFAEVIAQAHRDCYRPFLHTLHDYPDFRFAMHLSGWLLDWLEEHAAEDLELLAAMVRRGQLELFGAGDSEPVLAAIPPRDRLGQLSRLSARLAAWTGVTPQGAWLTERVWESAVVPELVAAGIRYVMVDDYHLLCAGQPPTALDGYFSTEEGGARLDLFPIAESLRYRLPFAPAAQVIAHLEALAGQGQAAAIHFDDIEKFGSWPETHDWVYRRGWLRAMIEGVLASPRIRTATYAEFHATQPGRGLVYLPSGSYSEMNLWTLAEPAASHYAQLHASAAASGQLERQRPFIRGGIWRNFLSRYPEANWMHKRMLGLSARLAELAAPPAALTAALYRAQANDAYWHGLFGGLYLPHLRRAVWQNLLELEAGLDALQPRPSLLVEDLDLDGRREILTHRDGLQLALRDDGLGAAHELSCHRLRHNFADTLRRHREHYHAQIAHPPVDHPPPDHDQPAARADPAPEAGIASAHDIRRCKAPISAEDLLPDALPRAIALDSLDDQPLCDYRLDADEPLHFRRAGVDKRYQLQPGRLVIEWRLRGLAGQTLRTTLNLAMPSCDGFLGRYRLADGSIPGGFGQPLQLDGTRWLRLEDGVLGGAVELHGSVPLAIRCQAQHSVSQSENGFEKIIQAVAITLAWTLPDDDCTLCIHLGMEPDRS